MNNLILAALFLSGATGFIAQMVIVRELFIGFYGNELSLGILMASWTSLEALGSLLAGRFLAGRKEYGFVFALLLSLFAVSVPFSTIACRLFRPFFSIPFGQTLDIPTMAIIAVGCTAGVALIHGALFICGFFLLGERRVRFTTVYGVEILGTIAGGILYTYVLVRQFHSFQITYVLVYAHLLAAMVVSFFIPARRRRYWTWGIVAVVACVSILKGANALQQDTLARQWSNGKLLDYQNSIFGNVAVTESDGQVTFFSDGLPAVTSPYPDITFVEEFGNLPVAMHPDAKKILVIGGGAGGILHELLRYPVERIDYIESDPLIIRMLEKHPVGPIAGELNDTRVRPLYSDGRTFLRLSEERYDVIVLGISRPVDLSTNRFFTREFFALVNERLGPQGVFCMGLPGSLTYMGAELRDLNFSVINGLEGVFRSVVIVPGEYTLLICSPGEYITKRTAAAINGWLDRSGHPFRMLIPSYIDYRFDPQWRQWFEQYRLAATRMDNRDLQPRAMFHMQRLLIKQDACLPQRSQDRGRCLPWIPFVCSAGCLAGVIILLRKNRPLDNALYYASVSTGFWGMLMSLVLVFLYQISKGYLYSKVGLLISVFMAGAAAGSLLAGRIIKKGDTVLPLLRRCETVMALYAAALAVSLGTFTGDSTISEPVFIVLLFASGGCIGFEFPLCIAAYERSVVPARSTAAALFYGLDLFGGGIAGVVGPVVLLPLWGFYVTVVSLSVLKIVGALFLKWAPPSESRPQGG